MKKRMTKLFSLALAVLMLISVFSVGAFAYSSDYVTINCPENFDEKEDYSSEDGFYVDVYYNEWYTAEDGSEYYTGNTVNVCMEACWNDTLEDYYYEEELENLEWYLDGTVDSIDKTDYYYETIGSYDAVVYDAYYTYTGEDITGKRTTYECLYSEVIVVVNECCVTIYVDVMYADDLEACRNELAEKFLNSITYNVDAIQEAEAEEKSILVIVIAIIGGMFVIGIAITVVIIVVVVKASKKKKVQQPVYPYNNMNVPPQYYNPGVNVPNGNQNVNVPVQTPPSYVQPPVSAPATTEEITENNTENLDN